VPETRILLTVEENQSNKEIFINNLP